MDDIGFNQEIQGRSETPKMTHFRRKSGLSQKKRMKEERRSEGERLVDVARAQAGDVVARDRLLADFERMIHGLVNGYVGKGIPGRTRILEADDLRQRGRVALLEAITNYEAEGIPFSTHAYMRIKDAILIEIGAAYVLTSDHPSSRPISKRVQRFKRRADEVTRQLGRTPLQCELYAGLSKIQQHTLSEMELVAAMTSSRSSSQGSYKEDTEDYWEQFPDERQLSPETLLIRREEWEQVAEIVKVLPDLLTEMECRVIRLYFWGNGSGKHLSCTAIGRIIGKSRARAYQAYRIAISKLQEYSLSIRTSRVVQ